jgi:hypothetical protein
VLAEFDAEGYTGQARAVDDGRVQCLTCRQTFGPDHLKSDVAVRLEGASDPADMLIVIPVTCPHCGTPATLVANYGPEAQYEEAQVLRRLERSPSTPPSV